jgi:hypothetical protein
LPNTGIFYSKDVASVLNPRSLNNEKQPVAIQAEDGADAVLGVDLYVSGLGQGQV